MNHLSQTHTHTYIIICIYRIIHVCKRIPENPVILWSIGFIILTAPASCQSCNLLEKLPAKYTWNLKDGAEPKTLSTTAAMTLPTDDDNGWVWLLQNISLQIHTNSPKPIKKTGQNLQPTSCFSLSIRSLFTKALWSCWLLSSLNIRAPVPNP